MSQFPIDPVHLARQLIRCPSVTPCEAGALDCLEQPLRDLGLTLTRLPFSSPGEDPVDNLHARYGEGGSRFCFSGHVDVVTPGDLNAWSLPPFEGAIRDDVIIGRGACDMKGAVAAFVAALACHIDRGRTSGMIDLVITCDEEGSGVHGTGRVLEWLSKRGEKPDVCLVGEPTSIDSVGDTIKIGRRGSLTAKLIAHGRQGHSAYPELADNPNHRLVQALMALLESQLDEGYDIFQPSTLTIASIDTGNPVANVIPSKATALINVRFNPAHSPQSLADWLKKQCANLGEAGSLEWVIEPAKEAFLTQSSPFLNIVSEVIERQCGALPQISTAGGTSDAFKFKDICPVIEFGLIGQTMHRVDEAAPISDIIKLTEIYRDILESYFASMSSAG